MPTPMTARRDTTALAASRFRVTIDGRTVAGFATCSGLGGGGSIVAVREGGAKAPRLFREDIAWSAIRLERGVHADDTLWRWYEAGDARDGAVTLCDERGEAVSTWRFRRGRVTRWTGPSLAAGGSDIAVESVEIVHEGLQLE